MAKIEAKLTVEVTPAMLAELFAGMDNEAQASFLLLIGDYTALWDKPPANQWTLIGQTLVNGRFSATRRASVDWTQGREQKAVEMLTVIFCSALGVSGQRREAFEAFLRLAK